ncbi:MAG: hypothetical protein M3Y77_19180 [Actinomycetota bacterium]|nr:hypothetical protein [Actinomycetota bacterium]
MNQDATARRRRRRVASRVAGPPTAAIDTPAIVDQSRQAATTDATSDPAPTDTQQTEQKTEQLDSGRRRTRRQRSQRRSDDPQDFGGGTVMPPDRPNRGRPTIEHGGENSTDEHSTGQRSANESVVAQGVPAAGRRNDARRSDHGLRGLEASRSTQVSPTVAMRAREYATPTAEDLAEAERDVQLVRRKYVPPTPLQASRRRGGRRDPAD